MAERAADDGSYANAPQAGHEVTGMMADFHTVHQKDADTYSVCLDFRSGEQLHDVDFFVDRTDEGLIIADHYLHKIDGEAVEWPVALGLSTPPQSKASRTRVLLVPTYPNG